MSALIEKCKLLQGASYELAAASTKAKNQALELVARALEVQAPFVLAENEKDVAAAREKGMKESLVDRLKLTESRMKEMVEAIATVIRLKDPVWKSNQVWTLENGLTIQKMSVPFGVIGIIYESRPNVTVDAFSLALKSGNGILLRGSTSALHSNQALVKVIRQALAQSQVSEQVIQLVEDPDRKVVGEMLKLNEYIDVIIPRGGADLIRFVVDNATVPTIETGVGNCHTFVDATADLERAVDIVENAKLQRPGACNALETLLVHEQVAADFLPLVAKRLAGKAELRGCPATRALIPVKEAAEADWETEYLDFILAIKVVKDIHEALAHIRRYGTKHSEAILTESYSNAQLFLRGVDAAAVYVNASTRFTDGGQFGFGAEMGISTQKIHARGPMGLEELVTIKYVVTGNGQIRE